MILSKETLPNLILAVKRLISQLIHGRGLVASDDVIELRRFECSVCPHRVEQQCGKCTCFVVLKTMFKSESCPDKRWGQQTRFTKGV